jgi:rubrerythrin
MISPQAQARLDALRERNDKARGRKLAEAERLENLRRAIEWTCIECGHEVEPKTKCPGCGWINF